MQALAYGLADSGGLVPRRVSGISISHPLSSAKSCNRRRRYLSQVQVTIETYYCTSTIANRLRERQVQDGVALRNHIEVSAAGR